MPTLAEYRESAKKSAIAASESVRAMAFGGLAVIWAFKPDLSATTTGPVKLPEDLVPILGVAAIFFVVNSALVSTVVALAQGVIKLGRSSVTFEQTMSGTLDGMVHAINRTTTVRFDLQARAAVALEADARERAEALLSNEPARLRDQSA